MEIIILIIVLFTLSLLCGKLMGIYGFLGSITGSSIAIIYLLTTNTF